MTKLFKIYVRPKLEYNTKKDINKIESVQSNFTRFICSRSISNTSYSDRLIKLGLKSLGLEYRR